MALYAMHHDSSTRASLTFLCPLFSYHFPAQICYETNSSPTESFPELELFEHCSWYTTHNPTALSRWTMVVGPLKADEYSCCFDDDNEHNVLAMVW